MSQTSTGRSKEPPTKPTRPQRVIRLSKLPEFLGVQRSVIQTMIAEGRLVPFNLSGGRSKVVFESEVLELQQKAHAEAKAASKQDE
jgi:hypothetical protein